MTDYSLTACVGKAQGCTTVVVVERVVCSDCEALLPPQLLRRLTATLRKGPRPEKLAARAAIRDHLAVAS